MGQVLPLFAVEVLQAACRAELVHFEVCAGEADAATAALARALGCCALSQDSDFFVFDIPAGALTSRRFAPAEWAREAKPFCRVALLFIVNASIAVPVIAQFAAQGVAAAWLCLWRAAQGTVRSVISSSTIPHGPSGRVATRPTALPRTHAPLPSFRLVHSELST
jgi:hypothetical protein